MRPPRILLSNQGCVAANVPAFCIANSHAKVRNVRRVALLEFGMQARLNGPGTPPIHSHAAGLPLSSTRVAGRVNGTARPVPLSSRDLPREKPPNRIFARGSREAVSGEGPNRPSLTTLDFRPMMALLSLPIPPVHGERCRLY